jgi:hypothetical protein
VSEAALVQHAHHLRGNTLERSEDTALAQHTLFSARPIHGAAYSWRDLFAARYILDSVYSWRTLKSSSVGTMFSLALSSKMYLRRECTRCR